MQYQLQVQFRNMPDSDFIYNDVWDHAEKLERFYDRIISCHVIISAPHRRQHQGKIFHVQVRLHVPNGDIFVTTEREKDAAHEDVYVAVRDAFDSVRRRLEDYIRRRRSFVKDKFGPARGKIEKLFHNEDCGFITTADKREIYFHRNSILNYEFDKLKVGDEVRFSEEMGEKGPQVTSMACVGHS